VPLRKFDWRMADDMCNKEVKQNVFTDLQPTNNVKQFLWHPMEVHVSIISGKNTKYYNSYITHSHNR